VLVPLFQKSYHFLNLFSLPALYCHFVNHSNEDLGLYSHYFIHFVRNLQEVH